MVEVRTEFPAFTATKEGTSPIPFEDNPIVVSLLVQFNCAPNGELVKLTAESVSPEHTLLFCGALICGLGFTSML